MGATGEGNGGNIEISTNFLSVTNGALLDASTRGQGDGGSILVQATDIELDNGTLNAEADSGAGGDIRLESRENITLQNNSTVSASTVDGEAGSVALNTPNTVIIDNSNLSSEANRIGDAGLIVVQAGNIELDNGNIEGATNLGAAGEILLFSNDSISLQNSSAVSASTQDGTAGSVTVNAPNTVTLDGESQIRSSATGTGDGTAGSVTISTNQLQLTNDSEVTVSNSGTGNAGNINVNASNIELDNSNVRATTVSGGSGSDNDGNITLFNSNSVVLRNESEVSASTENGNAGSVTVSAPNGSINNLVTLDGGSRIASSATGTGDGIAGSVTILTNQLQLTNDSRVTVSSNGIGNAGDIFLEAENGVISLFDSFIESTLGSSGEGQAGSIEIKARSLSLNNSALLSNVVRNQAQEEILFRQAQGGRVTIDVQEMVTLDNSRVFASIGGGVLGNSGDIKINAGSLSLTNESILITNASGGGQQNPSQAGTIQITVAEEVVLSGSRLESTVSSQRASFPLVGNGGNIDITAGSLSLVDEAQITVSNEGVGNAGNITISSSDSVDLQNNSEVSAFTQNGMAGSLTINAPNSVTLNNSEFTVSSAGTGSAGSLMVTAGDIELDNSRVTATTASGGLVDEIDSNGNITLSSGDSIVLRNNSEVSASTQDGVAGSVTVNAPNLVTLDSQSQISSSATGRGTPGSLEIIAEDIRLRNQSQISATATSESPTAEGNITINAETVILSEASEIRTRTGSGGDIRIRDLDDGSGSDVAVIRTPDSVINASGTLTIENNVELRTSEVISVELTNVETIVARACPGDRPSEGSVFVITGRGGLPPSPDDPLTDDTIRVEGKIVPAPTLADYPDTPQPLAQDEPTEPIDTNTIQPARGWYVNEKGVVVLTAEPIQPTFVRYVNPLEGCPGQKE